MNDLVNGLSLMLIGMGTVFSFLTLLVFFILVTSKIINCFWPESEPVVKRSKTSSDDEELVAVITSAVHQYRNKQR